MPLLLSEEQLMLQDSARDFVSNEAPVGHLRHLRDTVDPMGVSLPLWTKFAHMGYAGLLIPEAQGGIGAGVVEAAILQEQLGRTLVPSPFLATSLLGATALQIAATDAQKHLFFPTIACGEEFFALAVDEGTKHAPARIALQGRQERDRWVLSGQKRFVIDGHIAHQLIVVARTGAEARDGDGLTMLLLPRSVPGVHIERIRTVDSHNAADIRFDNVVVEQTAILGKLNAGNHVLSQVLDVGRLAVAAELLGVASEVFERTLRYLKERVQFGRKIGEFQGLQHRAARMYAEIEQLRAAILKAAQTLDVGGSDGARFVSIAKAKAGRVAKLCTEEAIQMHGGIGLTDELDIGFFFKRARVLNELFGDHRFHADRLAQIHGY